MSFQPFTSSKEKWHALSIQEVISRLETTLEGLSLKVAEERVRDLGFNRIVGKKEKSIIVIFLRQFLNPLIIILLVACLSKFFLSGFLDGSVLFFTILLMTFIGFFQEMRAEKAIQSLKKLCSYKAKVKRGGIVQMIHSEMIVPGDLLLLEAGDRIPADGRILDCTHFRVNESSLTGESLTIEKKEGILPLEASLADRKNMVYTGTSVATGKASILCVATGMETELGKIAAAIQEVEKETTPLQKSIHSLGIWISSFVFLMILIFIGFGIYKNYSWIDILLFSISAAIAAIPEGLPAAVTIVLATGMHVMAKRNALIRRLAAVETLGSTTLIASDKTGTLTRNQMVVQDIYLFHRDDKKERLLFEIGILANNAYIRKKNEEYEMIGDPTEAALLIAAEKAGIDHVEILEAFPRLEEIPFESEKRYMAVLCLTPLGKRIYLKGSPEKLLELSSLNLDEKKEIEEKIRHFSHQGLRLLAAGWIPQEVDLIEEAMKGIVEFVGIFAILDPPREEAIQSVAACQKAGIRIVMITGDNKVTAESIAKKIGIDVGQGSLTSQEIDSLSEEALRQKVKNINVYARIEPLHKLKLVRAFKELGHVVAMTGDGVNDAPALEAADIGIAMGITGTDVAKEASDMILLDDNFSSIESAVEEGRAIFNRLRFVTTFLLITCIGELLGLLLSIAFTDHVYLVPLQILWINLITGGIIAIPLACEPKTQEELKQPPRDLTVKLVYPGMIFRILFLSITLGISTFTLYYHLLPIVGIQAARTMVFSSLVVFEWLIAFNVRSDEKTIFQLGFFSNRVLVFPIILGFVLQLLIIYMPFLQIAFQTLPLQVSQWSIVLLPGFFIFFLETLRKIYFPKIFSFGKWKKGTW